MSEAADRMMVSVSTLRHHLKKFNLSDYIEDRLNLEVENAIRNFPLSMKQAATSIDMPYQSFINRAKRIGLYQPNQGGKNCSHPKRGDSNRIPLNDILNGTTQYKGSSSQLKRRLVNNGLLEDRCEKCGVGKEWCGMSLTLQLDHINGDRTNNRLDNLRVLCPNCHSQTETFGGRNVKQRDLSWKDIPKDQIIDRYRMVDGSLSQTIRELGYDVRNQSIRKHIQKIVNEYT